MNRTQLADGFKKTFFKMLELYQKEMKARTEHQYRIVNIPVNETEVEFQVIGKGIILPVPITQLMHSDLLMGFSKTDIALITHFGTKLETIAQFSQQPKSKILKLLFEQDKTTFVVEKENGEVAEYQAHELYQDDALANSFSGKAGMSIGYAAAKAHHKRMSTLK